MGVRARCVEGNSRAMRTMTARARDGCATDERGPEAGRARRESGTARVGESFFARSARRWHGVAVLCVDEWAFEDATRRPPTIAETANQRAGDDAMHLPATRQASRVMSVSSLATRSE